MLTVCVIELGAFAHRAATGQKQSLSIAKQCSHQPDQIYRSLVHEAVASAMSIHMRRRRQTPP